MTLTQTAALCERIMALSDTIITGQVDRERARETTKTLSEVELCRLLGYCGLSWAERNLLPSIWLDLKKQPDKASRDTVLTAFFTKLTEKEPSLRHYHNQALFEDIINHRFTPGDTYETCHKGLSPLAFLPRTFADMHEDKTEEDYYQEATVKTIGDVRKHRTKGPLPIPANDAELLHLNQRDVIVLEALFTPWSALVRQELDLNTGLVEQQMELFSNPESTREMIPQLIWAKIKARRQFFLTTCTKEMLDCPPGEHPRVARATLNTHTLLFLSGTKVNIMGVPSQWIHKEELPGPAKKAKHNPVGTGSGTPHDNGHYGPANPFGGDGMTGTGKKEAGTNLMGPPIFARLEEVNDVL
jgi:hypothetical protein